MIIQRIERPTGLQVNQVSELLAAADVQWHRLSHAPWLGAYPYQPEVSFALAHTGSELLLSWRVSEDCVRAEAREDGGKVWEDSCCELFLQWAGSTSYYNIECNCAGRVLVAVGSGRSQRQLAQPATMAAVQRQSSLGSQPFGLRQGACQWHMELVIPAATFALDSFCGQHAHGNFYKCGDALSRPHFLCFFPIDLPRPDFHCPEFFGDLVFVE